jgi:hypothetical protein
LGFRLRRSNGLMTARMVLCACRAPSFGVGVSLVLYRASENGPLQSAHTPLHIVISSTPLPARTIPVRRIGNGNDCHCRIAPAGAAMFVLPPCRHPARATIETTQTNQGSRRCLSSGQGPFWRQPLPLSVTLARGADRMFP